MNSTEKTNILIIDSSPANLLTLEKLLTGPDMNIVKATSGNDALALALEHQFALVLLDVQMPEMDGFATAELMRENTKTRHIPIIFMTTFSKKQVFKGYDAGAVDYLFKPLDPHILKSKVDLFLELHKQKTVLKKMNQELKRSNQKILEQQKSVIEEERLRVLLQMAGATVHELNQPITTLIGNIQLMEMNKNNPDKIPEQMLKVNEAAYRIADIMKKNMNIRQDELKPFMDETCIINFDQEINILSLEDADDDFESLNALLKNNSQINLSRTKSIGESMNLLKKGLFDLILLDYMLPDGNGLDFLKIMSEKGLEIPTVVITGQGDEMIAAQIIQAGAYDYLPKNRVSTKSLSRIIASTMEKAKLKRDIKNAYDKMAEMSIRDELTGLYNRRYFMEALEREASRAKRYDTDLVLGMIDLDHFKKINDTYGHPAGDKVLSEIGTMLTESFRESDVICRYGGEEFAIILPHTNGKQAWIVSEIFREQISKHLFDFNTTRCQVTASIGFTSFNSSVNQPLLELISNADQALYQAKESGRNRVCLSAPTQAGKDEEL